MPFCKTPVKFLTSVPALFSGMGVALQCSDLKASLIPKVLHRSECAYLRWPNSCTALNHVKSLKSSMAIDQPSYRDDSEQMRAKSRWLFEMLFVTAGLRGGATHTAGTYCQVDSAQ